MSKLWLSSMFTIFNPNTSNFVLRIVLRSMPTQTLSEPSQIRLPILSSSSAVVISCSSVACDDNFDMNLTPKPNTIIEIMSMTIKLMDNSIAFLVCILAASKKENRLYRSCKCFPFYFIIVYACPIGCFAA